MSLIRVFISIPIPDKTPLEEPVRNLGRIDNVRTSPVDQMHITLRFIGDVDESKVNKIEDCVARAVDGVEPFEITVSGAGTFPNEKRPSVVWLGASPQKTLSTIAERMGRNLSDAGIDFDTKPFKSHITIGRCRGPTDLRSFLFEYSDREFLRFRCDSVYIMKSVLGPHGAKHTVLRKVDLRIPAETDL